MEYTMYLFVVTVLALPLSKAGEISQLPVVLPSGHLADTPAVSLAKHHHLSAVAKVRADQYYQGHPEQGYGGAYGYSGSYHGYGIPVVLPSGHLADTLQVAAARSAHLLAAAKARADHGLGYGHGDQEYGYSGSFHGYGIPVVLPSGHLADTLQVAAARSAHLLAAAKTRANHGQVYGHGDHEYGYSGSFHGYGIPVVLPSGHLADTLQVAAARSAHLLAAAKTRANHGLGYGLGNHAYGYSGSFHGYGIPVVLPSGHLADTLQVAAARSAHLLAAANTRANHCQGSGHGDQEYGYGGSFHGYGIPVVLPSGHLADTLQVVAARAAHLKAVADVKARHAHTPDYHSHHQILYQLDHPFVSQGSSQELHHYH